MLYLCDKNTKRMEVNIILSVALAAAMIVVVLVLVAVIIYQRWQIGDKNATLVRFIDENEKMRRKIERTLLPSQRNHIELEK